MSTEISKLEAWYRSRCDGEWEHVYGVHIETLDNPGWSLAVELGPNSVEDRDLSLAEERSPSDWIRCRMAGSKFEGCGGPENLSDIIAIFLEWIE